MKEEIKLDLLCSRVCDIARNAGQFLLQEMGKVKENDIQTKGIHDYVTYVDKTSEAQIVKALAATFPEAGFIAEEDKSLNAGAEYTWVIDPLDGTTNFIHKIPLFSVSIALMNHKEVVLGVIYEPNYNECFYAWKGSPAFMNQFPVKVSDTSLIKESLFATGFPYYDYSKIRPFMDVFEHMIRHSRGLRRLGSAAVDLAWVACGRLDGFFEYGLHPWDVAAGSFIVQQAGGRNADFSGKSDYVFGKEIVSTNHLVFDDFMNIMFKNF